MIMKLIKIFSLIFLGLGTLSGCGEKKQEDKETLIVVTSADYPPFEYLQDGKIVGFEIDLVKEIGKRLGKKIDVKDISFDGILGSLQSGRADMAIASIDATPERRRAVDFTKDYYNSTRMIVCSDQSSIKEVIDLTGVIVGVQTGSTHENFAKTELPKLVQNVQVKSLGKVPDLIQDIKASRISCLILGETEAASIVTAHPGLKSIKISDNTSGSAIALPKGSLLTEKVDKVLAEIMSDGTLQKLKEQWIKD